MDTLVLNIPKNIGMLPSFDFSVYLAAKLYEDEILSAGQASSLANLSKRGFIELMGKYGVSPFSTKTEDLLNDITNA
jgi:predicted HTH domain antitoxin